MKRNIDKLMNWTATAVLVSCVMLTGSTSHAASSESGGEAPQLQARFSVVQWNIGHFAAFAEAGYTVANDGRYAVLDNVVVKGFDVKEVFAADNERRLSDHRIVGCVLEMKPGK